MDGGGAPGPAGRPRSASGASCRAALADSTSFPNAAMSVAAISASDLRSRSTPASLSPAMNWL